MRIKYLIRYVSKIRFFKDSGACRIDRIIKTRFKQATTVVDKIISGVQDFLGMKPTFSFVKNIDAYESLSLLDTYKAKLVSKLEALAERHARLRVERNEVADEIRAFQTQEKRKKKGKKKQSQVTTCYQAQAGKEFPHDIPDKQAEEFLPRPSHEDGETDLMKIKRDLKAKAKTEYIAFQRRYLKGKNWIKFPQLIKHAVEYIKPPSKKTLLTYFNGQKLTLYSLIALIIEGGEITHITNIAANAFGAYGIALFLYAAVPLAFGFILAKANIKSIGDWLRGSIHNSWRKIPPVFWITTVLGICTLISAGLTASDEDKISEHLDGVSTSSQTISIDDITEEVTPKVQKEEALPERSFPWAPALNYVVFALFLGLSTGVLTSTLVIIGNYISLFKRLNKLNTELDDIHSEYESFRVFLDDFKVKYEVAIGLLGAIQFFELLMAGEYNNQEVEKIVRLSSNTSNT